MKKLTCICAGILLVAVLFAVAPLLLGQTDGAKGDDVAIDIEQKGLVAYWKLKGDCRDYSGHANHGVNHGVNLKTGQFNGSSSYIEVPTSPTLNFGVGDFSISAWVYTEKDLSDVIGDILSKYDSSKRKGINLSIKASSGGYQSQGNDKHVYFGIDNAKETDWQDCGRPNVASNYVSNSLTVFQGSLYAATIGAKKEADWCHVYRYEGGKKWFDCGRVGADKTAGVMAMIVHNGSLYAATTTYDWNRVHSGGYDSGRVYRYEGGKQWEDCGQPGNSRRFNCFASYRGKLYLGGERSVPRAGRKDSNEHFHNVYIYGGGTRWQVSGKFPTQRPRECFPHAMGVHDGKLYVGFPSAYVFDNKTWKFIGTPIGLMPKSIAQKSQLHSLEVYRGKLHAGLWPESRVVVYQGGEDWEDIGRIGEDGTEANALTVYNGKLYGGSIPRAEVCRFDGGSKWTSLKRFYSPEGWEPEPAISSSPNRRKGVNEWARATSLTVYGGRLFVSISSCTSSILDAPAGLRGKVFSMEAGKCVSYDDDLGSGWKHITAVREKGRLKLYVNGKQVAVSTSFDPADYDISTDKPLKIGFGEIDYFSGKIKEVRIYNRALNKNEIEKL